MKKAIAFSLLAILGGTLAMRAESKPKTETASEATSNKSAKTEADDERKKVMNELARRGGLKSAETRRKKAAERKAAQEQTAEQTLDV